MYAADLNHPNPVLAAQFVALYSLNRGQKADLGFRPTYIKLLQALGNPERTLPPVIHVAGTNGKGSTIAFMRSILESANKRVHVYTSPHLVHFNESIILAGQEINDDTLSSLLIEIMATNAHAEITFFEVTTALAFTAFSRTPADVVLLEVGMGGRLDCTNIIEAPVACVITSIAMDHMAYLGETIEEIAAEKAGIMKRGCPCFIAPQTEQQVLRIFAEKAKTLDVPLTFCALNSQTPIPPLQGLHQRENLATAVEVLRAIFTIPNDSYHKGISATRWNGRLQRLADPAPQWELWLDGGHNVGAAHVLASWIADHDNPCHLIIGMKEDKDATAFLEPLQQLATSIRFTTIPNESMPFPNAKPWQECIAEIVNSPLEKGKELSRILICGSLYLVGDVLRQSNLLTL